MDYSIKVNRVKDRNRENLKGFAEVVFGDAFKVTNIAILENSGTKQPFVSMPSYRTSERDADNNAVYKDVCNPITADFREQLYKDILAAYEQPAEKKQTGQTQPAGIPAPEFAVTVTPYEREGSNIRALAHIYLDDSFIINNVSIIQGKEGLFVSMPSRRISRGRDSQPEYRDICYPVTKDFRERLNDELLKAYEQERQKKQTAAQTYEAPAQTRPEPARQAR